MSEFQPLPPILPVEGLVATLPVSFSFPFVDMALPGVGGAAVTVHRFLLVPEAVDIFRTWFCFDANAQGGGVMVLAVVQEVENGVMSPVTQPLTITRATRTPVKLERSDELLEPNKALYLQVIATPDGSGAAPWWTTATRISGTMHIFATE